MRSKKRAISATGAGLCAATIAVLAGMSAQPGRMLVSQEAADIANTSIDTAAVSYYENTCRVMNSLDGVGDSISRAYVDSIGASDDEARGMYSHAMQDMRTQLESTADTLQHIDDSAPTSVRVDGVATDFSGGLTPAIHAAREGAGTVEGKAQDSVWSDGDAQALGEAAASMMETTNIIHNDIVSSMDELRSTAPIYTEATHRAIMGSADCGRLMGGDFSDPEAQEVSVDAVVDMRLMVDRANRDVTNAVSRLSFMSDAPMTPPERIHNFAVDVLNDIADASDDAAGEYASMGNPYDEGTDKFRATRNALKTVAPGEQVYADFARVARSMAEDLQGRDPSDVDGVSAVLSDESYGLRDVQVRQARHVADVATSMDVPTKATADTITRELPTDPDKPDEHVVDGYRLARQAGSAVADGLEIVSAVGQDQASLTDGRFVEAVRSLSQVAADNSTAVGQWPAGAEEGAASQHLGEMLPRVAGSLGDIADAAERVAQAVETQDGTGVEEGMRRLQSHADTLGGVLGDVMFGFPAVDVTTRQAISEVRANAD